MNRPCVCGAPKKRRHILCHACWIKLPRTMHTRLRVASMDEGGPSHIATIRRCLELAKS